jgi:hypothetical protein
MCEARLQEYLRFNATVDVVSFVKTKLHNLLLVKAIY